MNRLCFSSVLKPLVVCRCSEPLVFLPSLEAFGGVWAQCTPDSSVQKTVTTDSAMPCVACSRQCKGNNSALYHCTTALHHGIAPRHCTTALHHDIAPRHCTTALHHDIAPRHCTTALHCVAYSTQRSAQGADG